ncbi:MAG: NAD-dependent epimerase/dehydratase family protein [Beijerinckiaceae bacterium]
MSARMVLVTGASGFIGKYLVADLLRRGCRVRAAVRDPGKLKFSDDVEMVAIGDLLQPVDWRQAVAGADHVVHLAGLAHAGGAEQNDALYQRVNTQATLDLADAAASAGVRRFILMSSIRAQCGFSSNAPLTDDSIPAPTDAYGRSKLAAERGLAERDIDWIALRPVLVYGRGVKANMAFLMRLARLPLPLPLGGLTARRSVLALDNLASAVAFAMEPNCPPRRAYIVADREPVSVPEMISDLRKGLGRRPGLVAVPERALAALARASGQQDRFARLASDLVAYPQALIAAGWKAEVETRSALERLLADHDGA